MTGDVTSRQIVPKSPACPEGLFLMDGIEGLRSLPKHSVDMLLTDPPYGTMIRCWGHPTSLCSAMNGYGTKAGVLAFSMQGGLP